MDMSRVVVMTFGDPAIAGKVISVVVAWFTL
jgi:hypothetical protein